MLTFAERPASGVRRWAWAIAAVVSLLLALRSIELASAWSRPIPYWDQWEFFKRASDILAGRYGFGDFIAQHNEHRIATSRVVFVLDLLYFEGSSFLGIAVVYGTLALIAALLSAFWRGPWRRAAAFCLFLGFLLSPAQWENLTSGFQTQFPFVDLFTLGSLALLIQAIVLARRAPGDRRAARRAWAIAAAASLLDLLAVFSMASGLLAVVPAIWAGLVLRARGRLFFCYVAAHGLYCALFLSGYVRSATAANPVDPVLIARFMVVYMGGCLRGYAHGPFLLGSLDVLCLAYTASWALRRSLRHRGSVDRAVVFAVGAALFMTVNAAATASGRASLGIEVAVSARYALQSIVLQAALFTAVWRVWDGRRTTWLSPALVRAGLLAGVLGVSLASNLSPSSREEWEDHVAALDKAGFALSDAVFADDPLRSVYPAPGLIREAVAVLASRKLGPFSPRFGQAYRVPLNLLAGLDIASADGCTMAAGVKRMGERWLNVEGWAYDERTPTGNGWIAVLDPSDHDRTLGFGRQSVRRPDVDEVNAVSVGRSGFDVSINAPELARVDQPHTLTVVVIPDDATKPSCASAVTVPPVD